MSSDEGAAEQVPHSHAPVRPRPWRLLTVAAAVIAGFALIIFFVRRGGEDRAAENRPSVITDDRSGTFLTKRPAVEPEPLPPTFPALPEPEVVEVSPLVASEPASDPFQSERAEQVDPRQQRFEMARRQSGRVTLNARIRVDRDADGRGGPFPFPARDPERQRRQGLDPEALQRGLQARLDGMLNNLQSSLRETSGGSLALGVAPEPATAVPAPDVVSQGVVPGEYIAVGQTAAPGVVPAGTAVRLVLVSELNTDAPGLVIAQVEQPVRDGRYGQVVIPAGTKVLGAQGRAISVGESRLVLAWERLVLPGGWSYRLPGFHSATQSGAAGIQGHVNYHYGRVFGGAAALSLISAGSQLAQPNRVVGLGDRVPAGEVAAAALGRELSEVSSQLIDRYSSIRPTVRLKPGHRFLMVINQDLRLVGAGQ